MPNVPHSQLTGAELHEPKGAASANAGEVYIADGNGSGSWQQNVNYARIFSDFDDTKGFNEVNGTFFFSFDQDGISTSSTADSANNQITISEGGVYSIHFNGSIVYDGPDSPSTAFIYLYRNGNQADDGTIIEDSDAFSFVIVRNLLANDDISVAISNTLDRSNEYCSLFIRLEERN